MKKKFLSVALVMTLLLTGCGTLNEEKIKDIPEEAIYRSR